MKYTNLKHIAQKLKQHEALTAEDEKELLTDPAVTDRMHKQWENAPDVAMNIDANQLWQRIQGRV